MGEKPKRLTVDDLHRIVRTFPEEIQNADGGRTVVLAQSIIAHFFGRDWFTAHIRHNARKPSFLNYDFSSDQRREATSFRVVELAESLFNLQNIPSFDETIAQMKGGGDKIEATCAELDFGRADAKCKLESTDIDPHSISTLERGRTQLPPEAWGHLSKSSADPRAGWQAHCDPHGALEPCGLLVFIEEVEERERNVLRMIGEGFGDHCARRFRRLRFRGAHSDVAEELDPPFGDDLAGDLVHGAENAAYSSRCGLIRHR